MNQTMVDEPIQNMSGHDPSCGRTAAGAGPRHRPARDGDAAEPRAGTRERTGSIEEFFPVRFCLNLDRRPDRRLRAWEQFRREGLEVDRLRAPDAAEMGVTEARGFEKVGPRACAVAHRLAWREARRRLMTLQAQERTFTHGAVLVFEDDVVLPPGFREKLQAWLALVPDDWQLIYLGGVFRDPPELMAPGLLRVSGRTWDMHAYAVRMESLSVLHRVVAPLSWRPPGRDTSTIASHDEAAERSLLLAPQALDTVIPLLHASLPTYAPWPPLAWQPMGLSNNEVALRGNYRPDGQQAICREAVAHLPGGALELAGPRSPRRA